MAPTNSNAQGVTTPGTTSAHGRNGFVGSRHILPAAAGQQEVQLTTDQQQAFDQLAPIFRGEVSGARGVLTGFAGTGKTFLTARLIAQALTIAGALGERDRWGKWEKPPAVVIAAPTHKAARQLERALVGYGLDQVKVTTLHSALGLRPVRDEGVETFQPDPNATRLIGDDTALVVLDEISMVSAALAGQLEAAMPQAAALVAIGDPAQLPPVEDPTPCPLFKAPIHAHLSQVVRHAGPILELATATRKLASGRPAFISRHGDHSDVVAHENLGSWRREVVRQVRIAAHNEDIDAVRVLCWTNVAADKLNQLLHRAICGPSAPPWVPGQPVVSSGVIVGPGGAPLVGSTCEMRLVSVTPDWGAIDGDERTEVREALLGKRKTKAGELLPAWQWWEIEAHVSGTWGRRISFRVLCQDHLQSWRKANNTIAAAARVEKEAGNEAGAKVLWGMYWRRRDAFGGISPVWAMTVHKAQGSTFERVFLHPDVDRNKDAEALNQLAYVGITRAALALHVVAEREAKANEAGVVEMAA
ncbi:AAA family ATPase [Synechococcus sp. Tobar12-5m-g]|uniref:ATP-dependent DNA helicase n=1 Tax=unclassified Synechococcus TaxID=2626047 RepID=UPI0020CD0A24|nr:MULTISPECIES: DEAD/DEAH box helicase [unclassified Synechococcus]MCP9771635.1 AAA family ATPase [Synechococcus sp. Tobar12-5m-g]MCP9872576.1 AAA family ATPase [Synechococcus sp. Cruz CV-v-12]